MCKRVCAQACVRKRICACAHMHSCACTHACVRASSSVPVCACASAQCKCGRWFVRAHLLPFLPMVSLSTSHMMRQPGRMIAGSTAVFIPPYENACVVTIVPSTKPHYKTSKDTRNAHAHMWQHTHAISHTYKRARTQTGHTHTRARARACARPRHACVLTRAHVHKRTHAHRSSGQHVAPA